jgi:hypothetical protein
MNDDGGFASEPATAGPFSPELNTALGAAFDCSLADLSVTRGADHESATIGADAFTYGRKISLSSSISEDTNDPYSMNVIAHEVAHALAGGGAGATLIDHPGDRGEEAADAAGLAFGHFAETSMQGPAPSLRPAFGGAALVHRHEIEGPWNYGDPVHEMLTLETLKKAGTVDSDAKYTDPEVWDYTRGVMWNDDPDGQLFDGHGDPTFGYSTGYQFKNSFQDAEKAAVAGAEFGEGSTLLQRSHFGDMQALHGMAGKDGEDPEVTRAKMLMWAELTAKVAAGEIKGDMLIDEIALENPHYVEMFAADPTLMGKDINQFFKIDEGDDLKAKATGSLLHMIQDSYADGHAEREDLGNGTLGAIKNFHSYADQDHSLHADADVLPDGEGTPRERLLNKPGSRDAIEHGAAVVSMIEEGLPTEEVLAYLAEHPFAMSPDITPAEAGEDYARDYEQEARDEEAALGMPGRKEDEEMHDYLDSF